MLIGDFAWDRWPTNTHAGCVWNWWFLWWEFEVPFRQSLICSCADSSMTVFLNADVLSHLNMGNTILGNQRSIFIYIIEIPAETNRRFVASHFVSRKCDVDRLPKRLDHQRINNWDLATECFYCSGWHPFFTARENTVNSRWYATKDGSDFFRRSDPETSRADILHGFRSDLGIDPSKWSKGTSSPPEIHAE